MDKIRIIVVDDHQIFCAGISSLLDSQQNFEVVGSANSSEHAIKLINELNPDVVLLDIEMPDTNGIALCTKILKNNSDTKVLALTWVDQKKQIVEMMNAGAKGYLMKDAPLQELINAITSIHSGGSYFSDQISIKLFSDTKQESVKTEIKTPENYYLTTRESEILELISDELTNKEIASQLFISPRTVETHRRNLLQKLKVKNTVGLVKYFLRNVKQAT